jgi:hypothetical protein
MREITMPSGAILKVAPAPFSDSKALYQALLKELKAVSVTSTTEIATIVKDAICLAYSSPQIEAILWKCMERCTYDTGKGALKIDQNSFEPVECRDDYLLACAEVVKENVLPFAKSLYAAYKQGMQMQENIQL